jgi:hypothetical protein
MLDPNMLRFKCLTLTDMKQADEKSKRKRERFRLALPVRVLCREDLNSEWVEMTRLLDVTPFGARFMLSHPVVQGRLLHLTLPMPSQLRCFDYTEQQYRVWALIRYVRNLSSDGQRFEVGVAFIGKNPPKSFLKAPQTSYEIKKTSDQGLWSITEENDEASQKEKRLNTRLSISNDIRIEVLDDKGNVIREEVTVTENISRNGTAVFTTLSLSAGCCVRVTSVPYQLSVIAVVRACRQGRDGIGRLHLEFVDKQWPLEGME